MNYEKRLKQVDAQRANIEARYSKATSKAYNSACFAAGEMVLNCINAGGGDWRGIKWEALSDYFTREKTIDNWVKWFSTDDFENGDPGKRLKEFKKGC
jgi:hypothetical protein